MIGIFGGTFDPVHYGHIKPALHVKQVLALAQLRFIPNHIPPHRDPPWLNETQRLALLHAALDQYDDVIIDERELKRAGPSYMVDTLASLREEFPDEPIFLIMGVDAFLHLHHWHQWKKIFRYCHLVVTQRPGFNLESCLDQFPAEVSAFLRGRICSDAAALSAEATGQILLQSVPQLDISSTMIRSRISRGESISDCMPERAAQQLRGFMNGK
jgi:nicotinate-nucleotide adenylyltransferase